LHAALVVQGAAPDDATFLRDLGVTPLRAGLPEERETLLRRALESEPVAVVVTLETEFFTNLDGRYRWTVRAQVLAGRGERRVERVVSVPVVLEFEHQGEADALARASATLAREIRAAIAALPEQGHSLFYFLLIDRFANRAPDLQPVDRDDPQAWHGGDLEGVIGQLDRLQRLGVTTLWLSPVFRSQQEAEGENGAFHGYWPLDLETVEPRFGDTATLQALVRAARARGIDVLLDWVANHVGYRSTLPQSRPGWFHGPGDVVHWDDPVEAVTHRVHGLPDLAQERPEVASYLTARARAWLTESGAAGLRLDAVRHVPLQFWTALTQALPGRVTLGELYDGRPQRIARIWSAGGFSHMLDFPIYFSIRETVCGDRSMAALAAVLSLDALYPDVARLVTFVDSHDTSRVDRACRDAALTALFLLRGTPLLTYGTEVGLGGSRDSMDHHPEPDKVLRQLIALRRDNPWLATAPTSITALDTDEVEVVRHGPRRALHLTLGRGRAHFRFAAASTPPRGVVAVRIDGRGAATGSVDALGAWDGNCALPCALEVPTGAVVEYKLIRDGQVEPGPNRALWARSQSAILDMPRPGW
jgi:hypothetical protein